MRRDSVFCWAVLCISRLCCSAPPPISTSPPSTTAGITSTVFPLPINAEKETRGGDTLSDSIDCSELNWDRGLVTVVPVSFVGVDSLDKTKFFFCWAVLCILRLVVAQLLLLSQPHLRPPPPESHPPCFLCPSMQERKCEGVTHCPI